jgi:glycosyltransferase involved in cell wall biosynthesis
LNTVHKSIEYWEPKEKPHILEIGSLNVNGTPQDECRPLAGEYVGTDMRPGPGVDMVMKAEDAITTFGLESFDVVISTEMLEHARNWPAAIYNMVMVLKPGGTLALTTRSPGFGRHDYPGDYWRFTQDDMKKIFSAVGTIVELEDDDSGWPGVGLVFIKNPDSLTQAESEAWLQSMLNQRIFNMLDFEQYTLSEREEQEKKPLISLVMIVKDETKTLETCLESVKSIVDEYVIVDTGSTDGTQEIIKKYGTLHERPFTNFVDSKNHALSLAKGRYILLLDADKSITEGLEFVKEHAINGVDCLLTDVIEPDANGNIVDTYLCALLWKNNGQWKFTGPGVHEVITGNKGGYIDHRIKVLHKHVNTDRDYYQKRFESYVVVLNNYLSEHPDDPRATFYLGRTLMDLRQWVEAIGHFKRYLALNTGYRDECWQAAHDMAFCWKSQGEYDKAIAACELAETINPNRAETFFMRAQIYYGLQDWKEALKWFEKAATTPLPTDVILFLDPRLYFEIPVDYLVVLNYTLKNYREALYWSKKQIASMRKPDKRIMNNLAIMRKKAGLKLFFTLGETPEPIQGNMLNFQGVGGVETTYIELPTEMAKLGHSCYVFCKCEKEHMYENVWYIPYQKLESYKKWEPDAIITSRWFDALYMYPKAKKIAWMQDAHYADPNHPDAWNVIDAFVCSSRWHRQYTAERLGQYLNASKVNIIPLSIRGELFKQPVLRDPLNVLYSSNPSRGLYVLQTMWDEISEKVPGIHLTVTYGWEGLKTWSSDPSWLASIKKDEDRVMDWVQKSGNIRITGRLPKRQLAAEMLASSLCLYPNDFWETYCLTALETQAAGVPMITTDLGALSTTLSHTGNILIAEDPHSKEYARKFIDSSVELMSAPEKLSELSSACLAHFEEQPDWAAVALKWETLLYHL